MRAYKWLYSARRSLFGCTLSLPLLCTAAANAADWDTEYWLDGNMTNWECGPHSLYMFGELRFDDNMSRFYYFRIAECLAYQARPWLDLEAHYSFIYHIPTGTTKFKTMQRLEFEFNPSYTVNDCAQLVWRNRLELIKSQGSSHISTVLRHRPRLVYNFENCGALKKFECSDEIFYNCTTTKFVQNRLIPILLSFELNSRVSSDLFFMVRNFYGSATKQWYRSFVLGTVVYF